MTTKETFEHDKFNNIFKLLNSPEELRDWVYLYFDLYMPMGHVEDISNSSSVGSMWEIYEAVKNNTGDVIPAYTILSARDSYKCQIEGSTLIDKNKGLVKIEEVNIGDTVWTGFNWKEVTHTIDDGIKKGIKLTLTNGSEHTGTSIHRYWTLRKGEKPQWVKTEDLLENDLICYNIDSPFKNFEVNQDDFEEGYLLGLLTGDGSTRKMDNGAWQVSLTTVDENILNFYKEYSKKRWNKEVKLLSDKISYSLSGRKVIEDLSKLGLKNALSFDKEIPFSCYQNKSRMVGFISGLFDTDGFYGSKNEIDFSITAEKLLKELQKVFCAFGIVSKFRSNKKIYSKQGKHIIHHLMINSHEIPKLFEIGCKFSAKKARSYVAPTIPDAHDTLPTDIVGALIDELNKMVPSGRGSREKNAPKKVKTARAKDGSFTYKEITYDKLQDLIKWTRYNCKDLNKFDELLREWDFILNNKWYKVEKKEEGDFHFYDLTVKDDHCYWSNGNISHNTLSSSILEVLLLVHFRTTIAHCSAILSQSAKSIEYCESFINKIKPYLTEHGWKQTGSSKRKIEFTTNTGDKCYIQIIVLSVKGANSAHTRLMFVDEVDLCDPNAYEEAKMIPGVAKGKFPVTVRLSTRKYSFGLMEKAIKDAAKKNERVLRWNLLDVAEYCPDERCLPDQPKVKRMIPRTLPLQQLSLEDFEDIDESLRSEWEEIEAYAGCLKCPLLSVCKKQLHDKRTPDQVGDLWKPIPAVITSIRGVEPDTGEAQLRCNKPSTKGLVFPRFTDDNIVTLEEAWEMVHGDPYDNKGDKDNTLTLEKFVNYLHELGVPLYAGMDYGYTANHAMIVGALLTSDEFLVLDSYSMPGLELDDIKKLCTEWQEKYKITAWFPDTAYPSYNKTLGKIIPIKKFEKDTAASISAIQTIIVNSGNVRRLKIIRTLNNMSIIDGIGVYHWKLHPATKEPTDVLDDTGEEADIIDAFRYLCQNLFSKVKNGISFSNSSTNKVIVSNKNLSREELVEEANKMIMYGSVKKAAVNDTFNPPKVENTEEKKESHGKKIIWKF